MTPATKWTVLPLLTLGGVALAAPAAAEQAAPSGQLEQKQISESFRAAPQARRVTGPDRWPAAVRAIFVGVSGGVGYAAFKHSDVASSKLVGPMLAFQLGYRITPAWAVSVVYTDFERSVARGSGGEPFSAATSLLRAQADCNHCKPPLPGGDAIASTFRLSTLGPAVDLTPLGKNGPFVGVQGGVAMASVTETTYGVGGTARAGLRLRPVDGVSLGIEGGVQGQTYKGGSAALGYGAAEVRLNF